MTPIAQRIAAFCGVVMCLVGRCCIGEDRRAPEDDQAFRPTVIVKKGKSVGSGTIIASVAGETLVLTAAHVVEDKGPPVIEVHRYNLGLERTHSSEGWPKRLPVKIVISDRAADLALLRLEDYPVMPFVARLSRTPAEPAPGTIVRSIGIDRGTNLSGWSTRIIEHTLIDMAKGGGERRFLLTEKFPDFGRSGGGLFLPDGTIIGVCTGRAEVVKGLRVGIFGSNANIHRLLRESGLEERTARSPNRPRQLPEIERTRRASDPPNEPR